ncbi:hypothetical protein QDY71_01475 [Kingella negevensis]|nr:hypothetical protein [Kingella negevensis]MDK4696463.1 hypothetical protein [Kingella negevensis]
MGTVTMLLNHQRLLNHGARYKGNAYISGEGTGIVTVNGKPYACPVIALDRETLETARKVWSDTDGNYVLYNLNPDKEYIVMAIDPQKEYEPPTWDCIKPFVAQSA